jgi:hypothetical protein
LISFFFSKIEIAISLTQKIKIIETKENVDSKKSKLAKFIIQIKINPNKKDSIILSKSRFEKLYDLEVKIIFLPCIEKI